MCNDYVKLLIVHTTRTTLELIHQDAKDGLSFLKNLVSEKAKEQAINNANSFGKAFDSDLAHRISVGVSPDGYQRIDGNLNDPDFAYIIHQATLASARTADEDKHKLLARVITERLLAESGSLVATASNRACEVIPYLTHSQLSLLGILAVINLIRPQAVTNKRNPDIKLFETYYLPWLETNVAAFRPLPKIQDVDFEHLEAMSCISFSHVGGVSLIDALIPQHFGKSTVARDLLRASSTVLELSKIRNITWAHLTSVGQVIAMHINSLTLKTEPIQIPWDK